MLGDQPFHPSQDYATTGHPVFAPVDSHSFYVLGYFEETKPRHIRIGDPAQIILYSNQQTLKGHVASIGRAIVDQSVEQGTGLVANIKPISWVRLPPNAFRCELPLIRCRPMSPWSPVPPALSQLAGVSCSDLQWFWRALGLKPPAQWRTHCATASRCLALSIACAGS